LTIPRLLAQPFQEGFLYGTTGEVIVLIDYRWNDGTVVRRWFVDPASIKQADITLRKSPDPLT